MDVLSADKFIGTLKPVNCCVAQLPLSAAHKFARTALASPLCLQVTLHPRSSITMCRAVVALSMVMRPHHFAVFARTLCALPRQENEHERTRH